MQNKFKGEFFKTRDEILSNLKENFNNWTKFLIYWSKILDKYSIDNILNLYSYNSYGKIFMTFEEWNSNEIDR